jgi:hypothetical protein
MHLRVIENDPQRPAMCRKTRHVRRRTRPSADGLRSGTFSGVITGAFLAEAASVVDNKLTVSGGVLSGFGVEADRQARFALVVLTQSETDSPVRRVEVEIRPPTDDDPLVIEYELPEAAAGGEIGFAFFNLEVRLPVNGRWVFVVTGGIGTFSLPLEVTG